MLRNGTGGSPRSIGGATVATATVALSAVITGALAGCTSSSSGGSTGSPSPTPSATSATPDTLGRDATASLRGSATITLGSSQPVTVATSRDQPATLQVAPAGGATIDLSMHDAAGDVLSLSGPAKAGAAIDTAHVAILLTAAGVIVDTESGNPCKTVFDAVSETKVSGTIRCETLSGQQKVPVTVRFSTS